MRIAYVTQNINRGDGQGRVCFELARHALREGHQVSLLTNFAEPELILGGARWIALHPKRWRAALLTVWEFTSLADRALRGLSGEFEIIHGFGYSLSVPHHINSAQYVHRTWGRSKAHPFRQSKNIHALYHWLYTYLNTRWEQIAYRKARLIIACSSMVKRELIEAGLPATKVRVNGNGVDLNEFGAKTSSRDELGLPVNVPLFLFVGDIRTPRKNLQSVFAAMKLIPGMHLAVIGALPRSPYPTMAKSLGIELRVHFLGVRDDVADVMSVADAFVFPSQYEPFGMVLLEAMASRLPVITASTVGAADLVSPAAGIVIPDPTDITALVTSMKRLIGSSDERMTMGKAGRAVAENHSWSSVAETYLNFYRDGLQSPLS